MRPSIDRTCPRLRPAGRGRSAFHVVNASTGECRRGERCRGERCRRLVSPRISKPCPHRVRAAGAPPVQAESHCPKLQSSLASASRHSAAAISPLTTRCCVSIGCTHLKTGVHGFIHGYAILVRQYLGLDPERRWVERCLPRSTNAITRSSAAKPQLWRGRDIPTTRGHSARWCARSQCRSDR